MKKATFIKSILVLSFIGVFSSVTASDYNAGTNKVTIDDYNTTLIEDNNGYATGFRNVEVTSSGDLNITITNAIKRAAIYLNTEVYGEIVNDGNITVTSSLGSDTAAIQEGINTPPAPNDGNITNNGIIRVNKAYGSNKYGYGIKLNDVLDGNIINNGEIIAENTLGNAAGISVNKTTSNASIVNTDTISVSAASFGYGIKGSEYNGTISNSGTITVNAGSAAYGINLTTHNGTITNSGEINATKAGVLDKFSRSFYSQSGTGSFVNTSNGKMYGSIKALESTFTNYGLIELPWNANGADKSLFGELILKSGSKLTIGLNTGADGIVTNKYSQLSGDIVTIEAGAILDVNVFTIDANQTLLQGSTLEEVIVANSDANLSAPATGGITVTDNSALLGFSYVRNNDGTIDLQINGGAGGGSTVLDSTIAGGGSTSAKKVAQVLDTMQGDGAAPADLMAELNLLGTDEEVASAVASLSPDVGNAATGAASQIAASIQGIVEMRQNVGLTGLNSGEKIFSDEYIWMKPYGSIGGQNDKDGINGFDLNAYGIGIGMDGEYALGRKAGVAFFYTQADVDTNNINQQTDLDVYTLLGYGSSPIIDEKTKLLYQASYSWQKTDTNRVVLGDTISGDYTSNTTTLDLKLLRDYQISSTWLLQPMVELTYRHFKSPSYSETSTGVGALHVQSSSSSEMIVGLGLMSYYAIDKNSKFISNINVGYDMKDDKQISTSSFVGASSAYNFSSEGIDNGRWSYDIGLGYEVDLNENSNLNFMYNLQGEGQEFHNNSFSARYLYKF